MVETEILKRLSELYKQSRHLRNRQFEAASHCECWSKAVQSFSIEIEEVGKEIDQLNKILFDLWNKKQN